MDSALNHQPPPAFGPLFAQLQQGKTTVAAIAQQLNIDETIAGYWVAAETLHTQAAAHRVQTEQQQQNKRGRLERILENPGAWLKTPGAWGRFVSIAAAYPFATFDLQLLVAAQTDTTPSAIISSSAADRYDLPRLDSRSEISLRRRLMDGSSSWSSHYSWDHISRGITLSPPADGGVLSAQPHPFIEPRDLARIIEKSAADSGLDIVTVEAAHPKWVIWPQLDSNTIFTTNDPDLDRPELLPQWIYAYSTFMSRAAQGRGHSFANPLTHTAGQHILANLASTKTKEFTSTNNLARVIAQTDTDSLMAAAIRTSVIARATHESVKKFFSQNPSESTIHTYYEAARRSRDAEDHPWKAAHEHDLVQIHEQATHKKVDLPPTAWEKVQAALAQGIHQPLAPGRSPETLSPAERISAQTANPQTPQSETHAHHAEPPASEPTL